jgi:hypothetical protein
VTQSLQHIVEVLRRAGLTEAAEEAQRTLSDPPDQAELDRFAVAHGLSEELLADRFGGSPRELLPPITLRWGAKSGLAAIGGSPVSR